MTDRVRFSIGVAVAVAAVAFLFWVAATGARWRGGVDVVGAESFSDGRVMLEVNSCHGNPELSHLEETDQTVEVGVVSSWNSFLLGSDDCDDSLEIRLGEPLGGRGLLDLHTGDSVRVLEIDPSS
jgi:hypothetical protein